MSGWRDNTGIDQGGRSGARLCPLGLSLCAALCFIAILGFLAVHEQTQRVERAVSETALASVAMYHVSQRHNAMVDGHPHASGEQREMFQSMRTFRKAMKELESLFQDRAESDVGFLDAPLTSIGNLIGYGRIPGRVRQVWDGGGDVGSISAMLHGQLTICTDLCTSPDMSAEARRDGLEQMNTIVVRNLLPRMRDLNRAVAAWHEGMLSRLRMIVLLACACVVGAILFTRFRIIAPLLNRLHHANELLASRNVELETMVNERTSDLTDAIEELTEAHQTRTRFLASVNHEMRTPMNGVLGVTALLERTALTPQQSYYVRTIMQSGRTLIRLIDEVLDFVGLSTGRMEFDLRPMALRTLIEDSVALLRPLAESKGLALRLDTREALSELVEVDPDRVVQIVNNLLGNAIKFTDHGHVSVTLRQKVVGDVIGTELAIADTGRGLDPEQQSRLFEPFERGEATGDAQGAGLGLAVTRSIVEQMGGAIDVSSDPGLGASFVVRINLPRAGRDLDAEPRVA